MRLRWTLALAFAALSLVQLAVVVPLALRNLSALLAAQQEARVDQLMVAVDAERARLVAEVQRAMDELAQSQALEDVARDAARVPAPAHVTTAAETLMTPRGLEVLALLDEQGRTLSSGHLPARLGEPDDPLFVATRAPTRQVPSVRVALSAPEGLVEVPALVSARPVDYGERRVWVVGGVLLGQARAADLARLSGAAVELLAGEERVAAVGTAAPPTTSREVPLGDTVRARLAFSQADLVATREEVLRAFLGFAAVGLALSLLLGVLVSRRVTRPVEALTEAAGRIAAGEPGATVDAAGATGELRGLVETFNRMTGDLKAATDKLLASERIAAWQEVARRLAHEIKNPLTPIRMSLETLLAASQRGPLDERFTRLLTESARAMLEEVERLKRIVDEFSQFARLPRPQLAPAALDEVVRPVLALYAPHDGLDFRAELEPGAVAAVDRDQLTQVLVNLIKNAEEAMRGRAGAVTVRVRRAGGAVHLEVQDEGPGVPADLHARLFEPYVTTKEQGTGLGLAIARRIAEEHGGALDLLPQDGPGACFRLTLPSAP